MQKSIEIGERGSFEEIEILKNNKNNFKTKLTILKKFSYKIFIKTNLIKNLK